MADCLDDNTVAALVDGSLSGDALLAAQQHIEGCSRCRSVVAAVMRSDHDDETDGANDTVASPGRKQRRPSVRGRQVGRYVVLDTLGAGGMGVVFSAYDPMLERKVALKLVRTTGGAEVMAEVKARLLREGKAVAQLAHPNIVAVFDMGESDGEVFIAMELVEGGSLRQWLKAEKRGVPELLAMFLQAGRGLAAAHRVGLVHRDFKPENVLVGRDGRARVTDFGLVTPVTPTSPVSLERSSSRATEHLTEAGALLGTPAYMSPEQHAGHATDAASDQFSFCVSLWESLYGTFPYERAAEPSDWRFIEPPADVRVPSYVRRALLRGLSLAPLSRYASLNELLEALANDPARARRVRALVALATLTLFSLVGGPAYWAATRGDRLCNGANAHVAAVWNDAVSERIAAAFRNTGALGADSTWARARAELDLYWSDWAAQHTEACRATRVRGEQSDDVLSRRMACLDRRRTEAAALLDVLATADADLVAKTPEAVDALSPLRTCSDLTGLMTPVAPPATPELARSVGEARVLLAEVKARFDSARYADALSRAKAVLTRAQSLGYPPLLAEAQLAVGHLHEHLGELGPAEQTLLDAVVTSEASRHDVVLADATTSLVRVYGARQARWAEARAWGRLAEGVVTRSASGTEVEAALRRTQGLVNYAEGHLDAALDAHRRAVALYEKLAPNTLTLADALTDLGAALRGARRGPEALEVLQRASDIVSRKAGGNSDLAAQAANGMANAFMLEGRFDEALALYRRAEASFTTLFGPTHFRTVTTANNIGVVLAEQGKYDDALRAFERVLAARVAALKPTDAKLADAHNNVGMLLIELGRLDEAAAQFERAKGILQGYPLDHFSQAETLLGEAKLHLAKRAGAKAIAPLDRVIVLCRDKEGFRFDYTRARANFLLGRAWLEALGKKAEGRAKASDVRAALVGFGAQRFRRDIGEIDRWLATHP